MCCCRHFQIYTQNMTGLLIVISSVLMVTLVAVSLYCMRLYGKHAALEKENSLLDVQNTTLNGSLEKSESDIRDLRAAREESLARVAVLESEKNVLNERLDENLHFIVEGSHEGGAGSRVHYREYMHSIVIDAAKKTSHNVKESCIDISFAC